MQFVFKGVPGESHESISMYGTVFPLGEPTNIEGDKFVKKLANHPHFEVAAEKAEAPTVEELRVQAVALGIDVDQRWGVKRLAEEISKKAE